VSSAKTKAFIDCWAEILQINYIYRINAFCGIIGGINLMGSHFLLFERSIQLTQDFIFMMPTSADLKKLSIVALVCLLTACGGSDERKTKYMEEGKQLFAAGDFQKAKLSFKNVLQIDPKHIDARYQLGETASKLGELQDAVNQYLAIINQDPKHLMSRLRMGQIYLLVKNVDEAEKMAKDVQAIAPENIDGMVLMASILASKDNTDGAMAQVEAALKKQPNDVSANLLWASLNAKIGKVDQAIDILQKTSEKNPSKPAPLLLLANYYMETKAEEKAQQTLEAIIKLEPKQLDHRKRLAIFYKASKKPEKAEAVLRDAIKELPDDIDAKSMLIAFLASERSPEVAAAELLPMIEQNPDKYDLRFMLVDLEITQKHQDKAEETLKEIANRDKQGPHATKARNLLARIYVAKNRMDDSKTLVEQILEDNPRDGDALSLRGEFALSERKISDAINDFRAVLVDQPQNVKLLKLLSRAHLMNNDPGLARESMEKVVEIAPSDESARLDLANLLQQANQTDKATEQINAVLKDNPNSKLGLETAFKVYLAQKQWDKAQETTKRLQEAFPKEGIGYFLSGLAFQAEGKIDDSVPAFENALAKQPDAVEPLTQLIKSHIALKQFDKAFAKLNETIKQQPKNFVAYNLLGGVYLGEKKFTDAMSAFKKAADIKPDWPIPYRMMAFAYIAQSNKAEAIKAYQEGIAKTKGATELVSDLVAMFSNNGEHDKAIAVYEEVYKQHPESMEVLNNLVSYLTDYGDNAGIERAASLVEPLTKINNPNILDTVGWVAYKQGNYARAQEFLLKVIALDPGSAISNYHLGMTYYQQKDNLKAREYLQKAIDKKADFIGADVAKETLKAMGSAG
jgi:tetratricopeptide (TPR) repeat protein